MEGEELVVEDDDDDDDELSVVESEVTGGHRAAKQRKTGKTNAE